jgi:hypothetical protein
MAECSLVRRVVDRIERANIPAAMPIPGAARGCHCHRLLHLIVQLAAANEFLGIKADVAVMGGRG